MREVLKATGVSFYACVQNPNKKAKNNYTIDLSVDEGTEKALRELGMLPATKKDGSLKTHEEGKKVFRFKRTSVLPDGTVIDKPEVYGSDGRITEDLIGNGSEVEVAFITFAGIFEGKPYVSANLLGVKVEKLVPFERPHPGAQRPLGRS